MRGGVTWAFEFGDQPYFAGFRELATNGIEKAVLNVYRMYGKLGGDWLKVESSCALPLQQIVAFSVTAQPDINAVASRQPGEVDVLIWNYHEADLPSPPADIALKVDGLPAGKPIQVKYFLIGRHPQQRVRRMDRHGIVPPRHPRAEVRARIRQRPPALPASGQQLQRRDPIARPPGLRPRPPLLAIARCCGDIPPIGDSKQATVVWVFSPTSLILDLRQNGIPPDRSRYTARS